MNSRRLSWLAYLLTLAALLAAGPASAPTSRPPTRPASTSAAGLSEKDRARLLQLSRRSLELFKARKYDEIERTLTEALAIAPWHATNLYNMACCKALQGHGDSAMEFLEKAADHGFTDFVHIERDSDLQSLHDLARYKALIARKAEFQRKSADRMFAVLKNDFGAGYLYEIDEDSKLIFATNTDPATLAALKQTLAAQAISQWKEIFAAQPDAYIAVVLPSPKDYRQIVKMPGVGGFYNNENHVLVAQRLGQIMTHEFTHVLHNADQEAAGQEHPIWLVEGLATLYEAGQFEGATLVPHDNFRLPYVQAGAKRGSLIPLARLLKMQQPEFIKQATFAYGQSGSVLLYLYDQKLLRKFYDTFKATYEKDASGKLALEQVTGKKLDQFEKDWKTWMLARTPPPADTGPDGAFLGLRFGQGTDGLPVDEVVQRGPADVAGIKSGDVLVGVEGVDVRDYASLVPILRDHKPGETITVRVRRTVSSPATTRSSQPAVSSGKYLNIEVTLGKRTGSAVPTQPKRVPGRP